MKAQTRVCPNGHLALAVCGVCNSPLLCPPLQVIVEKVPKSSIPDIDKKKFLVPADLSGMQI